MVRAGSGTHSRIAVALAAAMAAVAFAPLLSVVGCETACALSIMPTNHCGHSMSRGPVTADSGGRFLGVPAQQGLPALALAAAAVLVLLAPSRAVQRAAPVESPIDLTGTRIRI